ncbi:ribonuclease R [Campylobacter blaseri]|uniref:Ribonuclease R n=1 Tax=Campylobacter blaseri TaxID=2042961 RepID=A0A2P8R214_9BACT|nr:ribonuclease R family protein [Campylobacter blaseri]PSM52534.1 ribonuclease R [Campylobacter blaseri]PSM54182.1 ribonuclease R [Campylobacter blaseri]QKF85832.1 ribonuclease R [Campylobacter blaseri]
MRQFLENLLTGVDEKTINSENKEVLRNLKMINAVTKHKNLYFLNSGFICGKLDISQNGTGYLNIYDKKFSKDAIIDSKNLGNSKLGDIVLAKIKSSKQNRLKAKIILTLKPAFLTSVVYTKKFSKEILGVNVKSGLASSLKATQKSLKKMPLGTLLKIDNLSNNIVEVLGNINDSFIDEKISLALYNKNDEFNKLCELEAKSFGDSVDKSLYPKRMDLTHLNFCTIDPIDAKDFDDAVYYDKNKNELYVAIADVSEYVLPYTAIDKEAKFRGFSIYFPHKSVPMLPRNLSENICSLKPNLDRLAFCFKITLDDNYNVKKEELFEAIINSKKRFNYDEVDEIIKTKKYSDENLRKNVLNLYNLSVNIKKIRLKKGFDFRTNELRMELDENLNLKSTRFESSTPAHSLIEECMLLANKAAAKRIEKGVFRNHDSVDFKKIEFLLQDLLALGIEVKFNKDIVKLIGEIQNMADKQEIREDIDKLIIKAQKKAEYAPLNKGHFGLGFEKYTHFTSPIRRYSDLILHRLLKANLSKNDKLFNYLLLNIEDTCNSLNDLEKEADKVAYDFMDRKFARWAKENLGSKFRCYINENINICTVKLDDKIKGGRIFITNFTDDLLTKVLVEITDVDIPSAKIFGRVVKKLDV